MRSLPGPASTLRQLTSELASLIAERAKAACRTRPLTLIAKVCYLSSQSKPRWSSNMHGTDDSHPTTLPNDQDELDPREAAKLLDQAERTGPVRSQQPAVDRDGHGRRGPRRLRRPVALDTRTGSVQRSQHQRSRIDVRGGGRRDRGGRKDYQRATGGVSGPSVRRSQVEGAAIAISFLGSPVIQGAMEHDGGPRDRLA